MADSEDLKRLASGEYDLSRCDFREADLSGMDLSDRNFSYSLFNKARCNNTKFSRSNFSEAKVSFITAEGANFDQCILRGCHFGYAVLSGSSLRNVDAVGARFQHAKLDHVDMSGGDFTSGSVDVDTVLVGIVADKNTKFDGLKVLRATSRDPLFADYEFSNGQLERRIANAGGTEFGIAQQLVSAGSVSHSDGSSFSDGTGYAAPAADRIVRFNHNDPEYLSIAQSLDEVIEKIRTTNEHIDAKEGAIQSLQYAKQLWGRLELSVAMAKVGIVMALEDAITLIGKSMHAVAVEAIKASVVDFIRRNLLF